MKKRQDSAVTESHLTTSTRICEDTRPSSLEYGAFTIPSPTSFSNGDKPIKVWRLRQVWACISEHPYYSVSEIAEHLRYSGSTVQLALEILEQMGYIEHQPLTSRARTIRFPLRFL